MENSTSRITKKIFISFLFCFISFFAQAQIVTIPDANFKAALVADAAINTNLDTEIQVSEASAYTGAIIVSNLSIADLTGIEAFTGIIELDCSQNLLTTLDISANTALVNLGCQNNSLSALDVSNQPSLAVLVCYTNNISALDVSNNPNLGVLNVAINSLTSLDLSNNSNIQFLNCEQNSISSLSVINLSLALEINISTNPISSIDLSSCTSLVQFIGTNTQVSSYDFSSNVLLDKINVENNAQLSNLNIQNGNNSNLIIFDATLCPSLACIQVDNFADMNTNWASAIDATAGYSADCSCIVNIPDTNFSNALLADVAINTDLDGVISCDEASAYAGTIDVSNLGITDLTGIEAFVNIISLNCGGNNLASLSFSGNTALNILNCQNNFLTVLDVSANISLNFLDCGSNQLTNIDVSSNTALQDLRFYLNNVSTIDVSANPLLDTLICFNNQLTALDISTNLALTYLTFSHNQVTSFDASANTFLTVFYCDSNILTSVNIQNGNNANLTEFNATNNPSLTCVQVDDIAFMNTNWASGIDAGASYNTSCACTVYIPDAIFKAALVADLVINTNADAEIQCNEAVAFTGTINVDNLSISDLTGIEAFTSVSQLICSNNNLTSINVASNTGLTNFDCRYNQLTSLDVSTNTLLYEFRCSNNQITALDVSNCSDLFLFACGDNQLTTIDVSNNTLLEGFFCFDNLLTSIDVSAIPLVQFWCYGNQLTNLDVSNNPNLGTLQCSNNLLTNLDLSANLTLFELGCNNNPIISLDLSQNVNLGYISVSNMPSLTNLNIQNGNNINLTTFIATSNPNLTCIQVDDATFMNNNWAAGIDAGASYNTFCACTVNIPDANFKTALVADLTINTNADAEIQCAEASSYTGAISVSNLSIADMTGIEAFTAIDTLICTDNLLTSLNVSSNTALIYLCFSNNQLTSIDLSSNSLLIELCGQFNQLTSIDVTSNTALKNLYLSSNQLTTLDVSSNSALWYLAFAINNIASIDVSNSPELFEINCSNNQLTSLDLSYNTDIYYVYCDNNLLTSLDLSVDTSIVILNCNNNNLSYLNIQNGNNSDFTTFNATNNPNLTCIQVDDINFMNTNWSAAIDATASYSLNCNPCAALPTPQFTINTNNITTAPATAIFTNNTPNLGLYDFLWHFGDGSAINNDNATVNYTYNTNGNFEVSLTISDPVSGCSITNYDPANALQTIVCNVPTGNICGFTPLINPNGIINACQGSTVELSLTAGSYPAGSAIQWNKDGVTMIGENYNNHYVNEDGYYTVTVFSPSGCPVVSNPVQVQFNLPANNAPTITATGTSGPCGQINLTLNANGSFGSYLWNNGQTGASLNITSSGVYSVTGQSGVGCNVTSAPFAVSTSTFATPEICMIDVDSLTNHAVIIWEKPMLTGIMGFGIYKETALYSENYQQIAVVPYDSLSEYMDLNSDESIISERYRISIIDSCNGGETSLSAPARAMGLKVIPGVGFQRVLTWNYYVSSAQNFTEYKIYSGPNLNQLSLLATVPASINSNYIDANPINGVNTAYKIYADMLIPCESTRALRNRSRSNGTGNFTVSFPDITTAINESTINKYKLNILPNPNNGIFNLTFNNELPKAGRILQVFDLLGKVVYETTLDNNTSISLNLTHLENGIYSIRISENQQQVNQRLLITK